MKDIINYLMENKEFNGTIGGHDITIKFFLGKVMVTFDGKEYLVNDISEDSAEMIISDILYDNYGVEIRFCEICGKPYDKGFMAGDGEWYCCEECFEDTMNEDYGKGKWRPSEEEGKYGGWYEYLNEENEWEDTAVFYTEWN